MQKFLAVPEVFSLFLFYLLTKQVPQLVSLHSSVEEMLSKFMIMTHQITADIMALLP